MNFSKNREGDFMKKVIKAITSAAVSGCMLMPFVAFADMEPISFSDEEIKLADANRTKAVSYIDSDSMFMGDFDLKDGVTVSDARKLLRYTAGLEQKPSDSEFDYRCDMDGDSRITAADARLVLRIASKIDNSDITYLNAFNTILNSVKPDNPKMRTSYRSVVQSKTYDNKEVSKRFKSEMKKLLDSIGPFLTKEEKAEFESIDLDKELTSIDHDSEDDYINPDWREKYCNTCNVKFPLGVQSKIASAIDMSEVSKIEYKAEDTGKFVCQKRYKDKNTGDYGVYMQADVKCASITVYLKDETIFNIPEDKTTLNHGKLFNLSNLDNNNEFSGMGSDFKDFGNITGKLDSIKYRGSYVKLYFNNDSASENYGKPVYIDYNLKYNINVYSHFIMDIDFNKLITDQTNSKIDINLLPKLYLNDYFTLTTGFADRTQFYFEQNAN